LVVVVGSINIDLLVRVGRLPKAGETVTGGALERHGGGKGANAAVAAARAGAEVHFVGAVGDDDFGEQAVEELAAEKIDVSGITRLTDVPTGIAAVLVDEQGENQIAVAPGANAALDPAAVQRALAEIDLRPPAVYLLNFEISDPALLAAAQAAAAAEIEPIVLNPAPARPLAPELLKLRPLLTPNAGELQALAGGGARSQAEAAKALSGQSGAPVVVTLGEEGALMACDTECQSFSAPATEAVDATGAGDAFNGALGAALAQGFELPQAVRRAVVAASCSVRGHGARGVMPSREEIDRRSETQPPRAAPGPKSHG
jgi:ribokinase